MATEYELQLRREAATAKQEELVDLLEQFIRGPAGATVDLGTGVIPTLQTIVGNLEQGQGILTDHINSANQFLDDLANQMNDLPN